VGKEMRERLNAARALVKQGKHDEATVEFEWLWENIDRIEPAMNGVRVSFMAKNIEELIGNHAPARERFTEIRDRSAILAEADLTTARLRNDWIILNEILGEQERTLAWFDTVKDDERYATVLDRVTSCLVPLLESHRRFRDIGRLYKDPVATFVETHGNFQVSPECAADPDPDRRTRGPSPRPIRGDARRAREGAREGGLIGGCLEARPDLLRQPSVSGSSHRARAECRIRRGPPPLRR
jgi:hypothetical protein